MNRCLTGGLWVFLGAARLLSGEPTAAAAAAFQSYVQTVESRMARQHRSPDGFLAPAGSYGGAAERRLRQGDLIIERLTPGRVDDFPDALLHHWRGTAFAAGATAADFERLLRDFKSYPEYFAPQVLQAGVLARDGDRVQVRMRVRQRHVITVMMDTTYDITFGQLDEKRRYSVSRSTRINEVADEDHGFLWRLTTCWSYEERNGGLYMQIEAVSLSRAIPRGVAWAIRPYVTSVPRESLEFTLRSARSAVSGKDNKK
jgi:hypothetical protein